jgi:hypothetical protein
MKKTLKVKGCAHNPTFDNLQGWYTKTFEKLGWMVLAHKYNYGDHIDSYKKSTLILRDCIAKKLKTIVDPDKKEDLKSMLNNVETLIKHINKDFK